MNCTYTRDINNSYMKLFSKTATNEAVDFRTKMLLHNKLTAFSPLKITYTDGVPEFSYNITGLSSLETIYSNRKITYTELCHIITGLKAMVHESEQYILSFDSIILSPDKIFADPETLDIFFCYCPLHNSPFQVSFRELLCFFLSHINHDDKKLVLLAYSLQQESTKEELPVNVILEKIINDSELFISEDTHCRNDSKTVCSFDETPIQPLKPCNINSKLMEDYEKKRVDISLILPDLQTFILSLAGFIMVIYTQLHKYSFSSSECIIVALIFVCLSCLSLGRILQKRKEYFEAPIISGLINKAETSSYEPTEITDNTFSTPPDSTEETFGSTILLYKKDFSSYKLIYSGNDNFEDITLSAFPFIIGKLSANADGIINSPLVSRIHGKITCNESENTFFIEDLNSTNGTCINDLPIPPNTPMKLSAGDKISFANISYIFTAV